MAQVTGTYDTFDAKGLREDLEDVIYNISRDETPLLSNIGKTKVKSTFHEWQTDVLAAGSSSNAVIQGDQYTFADPTASVRVGNRTQISNKLVQITGTLEAVDKAGRDSEISYQIAKLGRELKKDVEAVSFANQASTAGNATTASKTGGLPSWLTSNVSRGVGGSNGGFSGSNTVAATDGTQRAFTEAQVKTVMQSAYSNGGKPTALYVGAANKVNFSAFSGIALNRRDVTSDKPLTIIGAADVYVSDFGKLAVVTDLQQRTRDAFVIDHEYITMGYLRPFETVDVAKIADAERKVIQVEYTLIVKNEAAHGVIADLT
jgi:hypothetical protein